MKKRVSKRKKKIIQKINFLNVYQGVIGSLMVFVCAGFFSLSGAVIEKQNKASYLKTDLFQLEAENQNKEKIVNSADPTPNTQPVGGAAQQTGANVSGSNVSSGGGQPTSGGAITNVPTNNLQNQGATNQNVANGKVAPKAGVGENLIVLAAIFLGIIGSLIFVGNKLKWF